MIRNVAAAEFLPLFTGTMIVKSIFVFFTLWSLLFLRVQISASSPVETKPNVVFLLADDLGAADLHCYGHPYARTPNIDSLAKDGTRFTQYQATGATCCPTRTGLMTSWFPARYRTYPADGGYADRITITELLKKNGYVTGHFGKWHMGPVTTNGTYGIDAVGAVKKPDKVDDERGRDAYVYDAAIQFIEQHKDEPFFVNVWGHIPHHAVDPVESLVKRWSDLKVEVGDFSPEMQAKFEAVRKGGGDIDDAMRRYLADVESLDDSVGRLLKQLDELGLRENTIVVFNTDQGADMTKAGLGGLRDNQMGYNGALRGGKHTHWEGGQRVPWIVRWPGNVPAGRVDSQSIISGVDWLPTLCAIIGVEIDLANFDGEDVSGAWLGKITHVRSKPLFWKSSSVGSDAVIREGEWKLRVPSRKSDGEVELYNLAMDPAESENLAARNPAVVKRLSEKLSAWVATLPGNYIKTGDKQD